MVLTPYIVVNMLQKKHIRSLDCELYSIITAEIKEVYFNA